MVSTSANGNSVEINLNNREWYKGRRICPRCRINDAFGNMHSVWEKGPTARAVMHGMLCQAKKAKTSIERIYRKESPRRGI